MINFSNFSLSRVQVTVNRYTGSYTEGIYSYTLDSTFDMWASAQPYSTIEQEQIFDPRIGELVERFILLYTDTLVYENNDVGANPARDLVIVNGVTYKPVRVESWQHLSLEHYRVILQKYDGD